MRREGPLRSLSLSAASIPPLAKRWRTRWTVLRPQPTFSPICSSFRAVWSWLVSANSKIRACFSLRAGHTPRLSICLSRSLVGSSRSTVYSFFITHIIHHFIPGAILVTMSFIAGELVTETLEYDGGRQVTVYVPSEPPQA